MGIDRSGARCVAHGLTIPPIFDRVTDGSKSGRKRGFIAVAHELCRIAYVFWKKDVDNPIRARHSSPVSALKGWESCNLSAHAAIRLFWRAAEYDPVHTAVIACSGHL